jgi:transcription initiation factor TFIIB
MVRGRSIAGIAAASLYAACRQTKTPRTLRQIADASTEDKKTVSRCYRVLVKELNINMPTLDPLMYLPKIANRVGAPPAVQTKGEEVLKEANEKRVRWGKDPIGFAAAALYAAGRLLSKDKEKGRIPHTQRDCANAANVTEVTVRNRFKELNLKLNLGL